MPAASIQVSRHLGFDVFPAEPTSAMQVWWSSSPYYDVFVYLYGSPNKNTVKSKYPTKQWLSTVEGYGWGVIPIWFGLQSSCIVNQPIVTQYFGPTVADASTQGAQQADLAVSAAQALGLPAGIIYTDIENYTVNSTCSPLVQAYVDGFVSEIHVYNGYLAGVYANVSPINSDISNASVAQPDAIWITKTPLSGKPPQVTIWNQGVSNTLWPNNQRTHQYLIDQTNVTWGNVPLNIDEDIEDAPVVPGTWVKNYTYSFTGFDCSAFGTYPQAIGPITNGGQIGEVVGYIVDAGGSPAHAFTYSGGSVCTTYDYPNATSTWFTGINSSGQIVGQYFDGLHQHGFVYGGVPINYPSALNTYVKAINDAGQIVGYWSDAVGNLHGFLSNTTGSAYTSFDYQNTPGTYVTGFNGIGQVSVEFPSGTIDQGGTLALTPTGSNGQWVAAAFSQVVCAGATGTTAYGVNNNGQVTGNYTVGNTSPGLLYDTNSGNCNPVTNSGWTLFPSGLNDAAQIIGSYTDTQSVVTHGFVATHQ